MTANFASKHCSQVIPRKLVPESLEDVVNGRTVMRKQTGETMVCHSPICKPAPLVLINDFVNNRRGRSAPS
jgi:hypothetical protein